MSGCHGRQINTFSFKAAFLCATKTEADLAGGEDGEGVAASLQGSAHQPLTNIYADFSAVVSVDKRVTHDTGWVKRNPI